MQHLSIKRWFLWLVPALACTLMALLEPLMPSTPLNPQIRASSSDAPGGLAGFDGEFSAPERFYTRQIYQWYAEDAASRLNIPELTGMSDKAFAALIVAKLLVEDATVYADSQPVGTLRQLATLPPAIAGHDLRLWAEDALYQGEISWGPANIAYANAEASLSWWERNAPLLGHSLSDVRTAYYTTKQQDVASEIIWELQTGQGAVEILALAILRSADRARRYYETTRQPTHRLSAYTLAMGVQAYSETDEKLYSLQNWTSKGFYFFWIEIMFDTARVLGVSLGYDDYLPYTKEERELLYALPFG